MLRTKSAKPTPTKTLVTFMVKSPQCDARDKLFQYGDDTLTERKGHCGLFKVLGNNQLHLRQEVIGHPNRKLCQFKRCSVLQYRGWRRQTQGYKPLHVLILARYEFQTLVLMHWWAHSHSGSNQGCRAESYSFHPPRELCHAFSGSEYMVAIYSSWHTS